MHSGAPEPQSMEPVAQGFPVSQTTPGTHVPQPPAPSQTSPVGPQEVPAVASIPVSKQLGVEPQRVTPRRHG
jgi:hypothetical protein